MDEWIQELEKNLDRINESIESLKRQAHQLRNLEGGVGISVTSMQYADGQLAIAPLLLAKANTVHALVDAYIWQSNRDVEDAKKDRSHNIVVESSECECGEPISKWKTPEDRYFWSHDDLTYKTGTHDAQP